MFNIQDVQRDLCHVAFWVCGDFGGEGVLRKVGLNNIKPFNARYVCF
ncbi:DUF3265 domain-containing protein [Vibrio fluvialis]|nr:DUF3265 domain-containing protein [Vibrio fluvialis]